MASHETRFQTDRRANCRVAAQGLSGSQFRGEIGGLLHRRLRTVALIALLPMTLFFLRTVTQSHHRATVGPVAVALHGALCCFLVGLAVALFARPRYSLNALRQIELSLFLALASYFSYMQVHALQNTSLFWLAACDPDFEVVRVWIQATAVRWFFLIVIYGVFIPNTWQRCALLTGLAALLPLVLTPLGAVWDEQLCQDVWYSVIDLAILMGTAVSIAVFGSYRLQKLQQQAFQAKQLGQYRLGRKLGAGGMGDVYLAEHLLLRRPCAIKLIRQEQTRDPSALERFEREVQAMATLTHWNTVEVYDYGRADDGRFYYVMEYLPGPNLEALVARSGPLPPARALHILRQTCQALREAHAMGLLHRDIKPSNIIVCERGGVHDVVKLLDFGLVQETGLRPEAARLTLQGAVLGSPPYMSPEQAAGRTDLDTRSDIYSLGAVGHFLLTGDPPFVRDTPMEMLLAHAYEPVAVRDEIPRDLQTVLLRCLSKKPDGRFASVAALDEALSACFEADAWTEERAAAWWSGPLAPEEAVMAARG
jgi:serine/threonine-protein kinase